MIIIEISKPQTIKTVKRKTDGQTFHIPEQQGWAYLPGEEHPVKLVVGFEREQPGYLPGKYKLMPLSLYVDNNGNLAIRKALILEPIVASVSTQKAA